MNRPLRASIVVVFGCLCFGSGAWYASSRSKSIPAGGARRILYYQDPMHPAYQSDRPGTAPDCGMELEPVYAEAAGEANGGPPGTVRISAEKQQLMGLRTAVVENGGGVQSLRTVGRVTVDDTQVYRLTAAVDGWIVKTFPKPSGSPVKKGEPLMSFYSRDLLGAEQAYFYSIDSLDRMRQAGPVSEQQTATSLAQIQLNKDSLLSMGMGEQQIAEIAGTRKLTQEALVTAPIDGFVLARNVSPGLRFDRGLEFYRVADLSHVWITAELYESDAAAWRPGSEARITWHGKTLSARTSDAAPQFDGASRTLRVRLDAGNPGFVLRPDMFVDVEMPQRLPPAVTVPADAVVDSGRHTVVYVERAEGVFEPRAVEIAWRSAGSAAIARGLEEGERVVTGGNFLLDSESRLQLAAAGGPAMKDNRTAEATDPVCGMKVNASSRYTSPAGNRDHRFCSEKCKRDFDANPGKYSRGGA